MISVATSQTQIVTRFDFWSGLLLIFSSNINLSVCAIEAEKRAHQANAHMTL